MAIISVIICTYNRERLLGFLLQSLREQTANENDYEIIIVDNNSTDGTAQLSRDFCLEETNARYIKEERQGLSHARNRGLKDANGDYVAYIDDDAKAPPEWVEIAIKMIRDHSPAVFGGPYYAAFEKKKPKWAKDEYWSSTEWLGKETRWFENKERLTGGNIFIKREMLEEVGGFSPEFGMTGRTLNYGEDDEIQDRLQRRYPSIGVYYSMDLYIYHFVREDKLSPRWYFRRRVKNGIVAYRLGLRAGKIKSRFRDFPKAALRLIFRFLQFIFGFILEVVNRSRDRYPYLMNYIYEVGHDAMWMIGYEYERARQSLKIGG